MANLKNKYILNLIKRNSFLHANMLIVHFNYLSIVELSRVKEIAKIHGIIMVKGKNSILKRLFNDSKNVLFTNMFVSQNLIFFNNDLNNLIKFYKDLLNNETLLPLAVVLEGRLFILKESNNILLELDTLLKSNYTFLQSFLMYNFNMYLKMKNIQFNVIKQLYNANVNAINQKESSSKN